MSFVGDVEMEDNPPYLEKLQKHINLIQYLPFKHEYEKNRQKYFCNLKANLIRSIANKNANLNEWISSFNSYLKLYGYSFTKDEHVFITKICYQTLVTFEKDLNTDLCKILVILLKKPNLLSRNDLELDWRPLFVLTQRTIFSSDLRAKTLHLALGYKPHLVNTIKYCRVYFSKNSTSEMLEEWKSRLCVQDIKFYKFVEYFSLFLPTLLYPQEHEFGFKLWLEDFMTLWISLPNTDTYYQVFFVSLFSRLAEDANGFINWDPYIPMIFERFMSELNKKNSRGFFANDIDKYFVNWIIYMISPSSSCLENLKKFANIRSYNYLVDYDSHFHTIISQSLDVFLKRMRKEFYKKDWHFFTPASHLITENIKQEFSLIFQENFLIVYFDKFQVEDLYNLVTINPKLFAVYTFEKLELAYEQISEPKRLETSLRLLSASLIPIFTDEVGLQYRNFLLQFLLNLTNSINTNDENICFFHIFVIKAIFDLDLPLIDCSDALNVKSELNECDSQLCIDSAQLENFGFQFLNCCFTIIESNNEHLFNKKFKTISMEDLIFDTFVNILIQSSAKNSKLLIDKLFFYSTSNIFEEYDCCSMLGNLIRASAKTNPSYTMQLFFKHLYDCLLSITNNANKLSDLSKCEFFYNLKLLRVCFCCRADVLFNYQTEIIHLMKQIVKIDFEDNNTNLVVNILSELSYSLTFSRAVRQSLFSKSLDFKENIPILNWPKLIPLDSSLFIWQVPDSNATSFVKLLFETFVKSELDRLDKWSKSEESTFSGLKKSLSLIYSFARLGLFLPSLKDYDNFKEGEFVASTYLNDSDNIFTIDFDGYNVREEFIRVMSSVVRRLQSSIYDNIDSIETIILILESCVFPFLRFTFQSNYFEKKLSKQFSAKDGHQLRAFHHKRMDNFVRQLVYEYCSVLNSKMTPAAEVAIDSLLLLSTCCYSQIRKKAQRVLAEIFKFIPKSTAIALPRLVTNIQDATNYEDYIGTLYLILENYESAILFDNNFNTLIKLWPLLITQNKFAEKPRIIEIFDDKLSQNFRRYFTSITIRRNSLTDICNFFTEANRLNFDVFSLEEVKSYNDFIRESNEINQNLYYQLINDLVRSLGKPQLHWRFYSFGLSMLNYLIRSDVPFPQNAIEFFVDNLIHDSIDIRSIATIGCVKILRPKKNLSRINYDEISRLELVDCYMNEELFSKTTFFDKAYVGYFANVSYAVSSLSSSNAQDRSSVFTVFADRFKSEQFLDKLIDFSSLDNSKTIDLNFVKFWKYLFQNYKSLNISDLHAKIRLLLSKGKHNFDKYAIEIMSGLIKASKCFNYNETTETKIFLMDIFFTNLVNFNSESINYWDYLFKCLFKNRDTRRNLWAHKFLLNENSFIDKSPYYLASFLDFTFYASQRNWKFNRFNQNILTLLENNLCNDYQNVRKSIAELLSTLFINIIPLKCAQNTVQTSLMRKEFVERIIVRLDSEMGSLFVACDDENDSNIAAIKSEIFNCDSKKGKQLLNLIETLCFWIDFSLKSQILVDISDFIPLIPYLCLVQSSNAMLVSQIAASLTRMANIVHRSQDIDQILLIIAKISKIWNWHSRKLMVMFIRYFVFNNYFTLVQNKEWVKTIVEITVQSMHDEMPEVRDSACLTLSGLISMNFIDTRRIDELITKFKSKAYHGDTLTRHGAILGLCSFVYAYPLDIPVFLPDILLFLIDHLSASQTISKSIKSAMNSFKKSHTTNWIEHKKKFTAEQLSELTNILISPSYYC